MTYSLHGHDLMIHLRTRSWLRFMFGHGAGKDMICAGTHRREPDSCPSFRTCSRSVLPNRKYCRQTRNTEQALDLLHNGFFRTGLYELTLMSSDCAEVAASETSPVRIDGILNHIICRYPLALVSRMRQFGKRQVPEGIHIFLTGRRIRGINLHIAITAAFDDGIRCIILA